MSRLKALPKPKAPRELTAEQRAEQAIRFTGRNPGEVDAIFEDCEARLQLSRDSGTYERTNPPWRARR